MTDSTATLGRMLIRNAYALEPYLGDSPEGGVKLSHVNGCHDQLSDVLSRLMKGSEEFLPEGLPKPMLLAAPKESSARTRATVEANRHKNDR
ncbi:hypothetical protein FOZ60_003555 [Perkinsus olseni]|uniref:Uncharacterized protein n=1 Tax=Perkinsus olseni TaxID=32597 RepID=A0A7J6NVY1_PEROL|nr:hypothetical protein FOZ60_003555 [Perkinsus olseni]